MIQSTRGLVTEALTDSGWTLSGTVTDDGGGGGTVTTVAGGTVSCRIDSLGQGAGETSVANRISDRSTHLITLPPSTDVATDDQFYVSGRGTYEVTAVREHTGEFTTVIEAVERA